MYDEDGTLLAETGLGGANSAGSTQYIYLPTANGPMPIAAVINGNLYAVHSDHLNTPRRLTDASSQPVSQWAYSAFGDTKPTTANNGFVDLEAAPNPRVTSFAEFVFNLRWPGQYYDKESGLFDNRFRSLDPRTGRYTQNDPIGLSGGWNRVPYANLNPLIFTDPLGLWSIDAGGFWGPGMNFTSGMTPGSSADSSVCNSATASEAESCIRPTAACRPVKVHSPSSRHKASTEETLYSFLKKSRLPPP